MWKPTGNPLVKTVARSAFVLNMPGGERRGEGERVVEVRGEKRRGEEIKSEDKRGKGR